MLLIYYLEKLSVGWASPRPRQLTRALCSMTNRFKLLRENQTIINLVEVCTEKRLIELVINGMRVLR